ncbi:adrenodoxin, mitochondrial [Protopterus annectens]|uniref:adrenodoxin, mitochondrial n=1 Tax=Protopterus annectens TaxID=7888 RepID=UPI001CFBFAEE|nr:adrenodoxin, mitochondrial [Protopterus annectens]XP_043928657.1 adrenodoxin, mitochondrial [Protopterus annectens]XP_043928658.1 adrenodoxin, mitochondrial [Protopterus annectens]XP_043928659.1 adrenodoxin, mitochondrial [Protopterus annectens]XP_043928660.1 adrenodoxin, mitochondrial [Protopterus annectens]XP_043928661.1 adrenodoxin, mitochondrial [Protopterus annectens]
MAAVVNTRALFACRRLVSSSRFSGFFSASSKPCGLQALCRNLNITSNCSGEDKVTVHFINRDNEKLTAVGKIGDSLLDVVINNNLDIDGYGACEGTLACSTCHVIFEEHIFKQLDPITDEEMDMLDLAYGLTEQSRLGCQVCLTKKMNGMTVRVPEAVADVRQAVDVGKSS